MYWQGQQGWEPELEIGVLHQQPSTEQTLDSYSECFGVVVVVVVAAAVAVAELAVLVEAFSKKINIREIKIHF